MSAFTIVNVSIIVSLSLYITILLLSFIFGFGNMIKIGCILTFIFFICLVIYLVVRRDKKSVFITAILNSNPLYPLGFYYANEQMFPSTPGGWIFFVVHYLSFSLDFFVTLIASYLKVYPIKQSDQFVIV